MITKVALQDPFLFFFSISACPCLVCVSLLFFLKRPRNIRNKSRLWKSFNSHTLFREFSYYAKRLIYNWPVSWQIVIKTTQVSILAHPKIVFLLLLLQMYHLLSLVHTCQLFYTRKISKSIMKLSSLETNDFSSSSLSSQKTMWIYKCRIVRAKQKKTKKIPTKLTFHAVKDISFIIII